MGIDNVECMPDPTLLLTAKHYEKLMPKTDTASDYILVYHLGNNIDFDNLKTFAKQKDIEKIVIVTGDNHVNGIEVSDDRLSILRKYPTIQEWLSLMKNAKYIVTDSFHGTVFSIIFNKNFGVYLINGNGSGKNDRIYSLLDRLNLSEHIITNNLHILDADINYEQVNKMVENDSARVLKSFEEWLKNE
jgi:exopolysaccharide biosynthesis predicted pyruvyltransferase EpsI